MLKYNVQCITHSIYCTPWNHAITGTYMYMYVIYQPEVPAFKAEGKVFLDTDRPRLVNNIFPPEICLKVISG